MAEQRSCAWLGCDLPADGYLEIGEFRIPYCAADLKLARTPKAERPPYDPNWGAWRGPRPPTVAGALERHHRPVVMGTGPDEDDDEEAAG